MPLVLTKWAINRRGLVSCRLNRATVYIFDSITNDGGKNDHRLDAKSLTHKSQHRCAEDYGT